jgi:hypothetical protein
VSYLGRLSTEALRSALLGVSSCAFFRLRVEIIIGGSFFNEVQVSEFPPCATLADIRMSMLSRGILTPFSFVVIRSSGELQPVEQKQEASASVSLIRNKLQVIFAIRQVPEPRWAAELAQFRPSSEDLGTRDEFLPPARQTSSMLLYILSQEYSREKLVKDARYLTPGDLPPCDSHTQRARLH